MRTRFLSWLSLAVVLGLAGCQLTLITFVVPATVPPGQVFVVSVSLAHDGVPGIGGGVLQVPNGFTVVGIQPPMSQMVRDLPSLLATYTAEPGHYLASWSLPGQSGFNPFTFHVSLLAPAAPTTATFKVALAGTAVTTAWQASAPAGVTDFAQITTAAHAQSLVVGQPGTDFAIDAIGLPYATLTPPFYGVALHDFDHDGNDDLATTYRAFRRNAVGWSEASVGLTNPSASVRIAAGDFDGDGFTDLVQGNGQVFFGNGGTAWTPGPQLTGAAPTLGVAVADVDGDGRDDIALSGYYQEHVRVHRGNANRTFTNASTGLPTLPTLGGQELQLRDVTGDGFVDVVWHQVWAGNAQGTWSPSTGLTGNSAWGVDAGDLDGDGLPEVVHANQSAGVAIHRHLGGNNWNLLATLAPPGRSVSSVAVLDYDRDGRNDLALGFYDITGGIQLWRNLGGMVFAPVAGTGLPSYTPTYVTDLAVGDINGDTFPDLAATFFGEGTAVFQNWRGGLAAYGTGCAGPLAQPPLVQGTGAPLLGNASFGVQVGGGTPGTIGFAWLGTSRLTWSSVALPLDLGLLGVPGCTLWTGPEAISTNLFDASGVLTYPVPIPANPALLRQTFFAQGAAYAAGSGALPSAWTAGLAIRIQ